MSEIDQEMGIFSTQTKQPSTSSPSGVLGVYSKQQPQPQGVRPRSFQVNPRSFMKGGVNKGIPAYLLKEDEWRDSRNFVFDYDRAKAVCARATVDQLVADTTNLYTTAVDQSICVGKSIPFPRSPFILPPVSTGLVFNLDGSGQGGNTLLYNRMSVSTDGRPFTPANVLTTYAAFNQLRVKITTTNELITAQSNLLSYIITPIADSVKIKAGSFSSGLMTFTTVGEDFFLSNLLNGLSFTSSADGDSPLTFLDTLPTTVEKDFSFVGTFEIVVFPDPGDLISFDYELILNLTS